MNLNKIKKIPELKKKDINKKIMPKTYEKINHEFAERYGIESQLCMLMEECAELIQCANKYKRSISHGGQRTSLSRKRAYANLEEEIADVEICIDQIKYLCSIPDSDINEIKHDKIERQLNRIKRGQ